MKHISLFLLSLLVIVLSFQINSASAKTLSQSEVKYTKTEIVIDNNNTYKEYVYIGEDLFVITYDDDGRVMYVEPAE